MTNIHTIFSHTTDNNVEGELGIDDDGNLYWNNKLVITKKTISLEWWVNISIIIASLSTLAMAVYMALEFHFKN